MKRTLGLAKCVPTAMLREQQDNFGLGCTSLTSEYAAAAAKGLIEGLQDTALRGEVTRALLTAQLKSLNGMDPHACGAELNYCIRARQLATLHASDMQLRLRGQEQFPLLVSGLWSKAATFETNLRTMPALRRLLRLPGITDIRQLINAPGTHVLSARQLEIMTGRALPKAASLALAHLTATLCSAQPAAGGTPNLAPTQTERKLLAKWTLPPAAEYPRTQGDGRAQRTIGECMRLLTDMTGAGGPPPTQAPPQDGVAAPPGPAENEAPALPAEPQPDGPVAGTQAPATGNTQRRLSDWHRSPCGHRRAARDETRETVMLSRALHDPPSRPVTGAELRTRTTRQALADRREKALRNQLTKSERTNPTQLQKVAGTVTAMLYDDTYTVAAVHASRLVRPPRKHKKDTGTRPAQLQMLTEWRPSLIDEWALSLMQRAGHKVQSTSPVSREEIFSDPSHPHRQQISCELCCDRHAPNCEAWWCHTCHRRYHPECVGLPRPHPSLQPHAWTCAACNSVGQAQHGTGLLLVQWERTWEPLGRSASQPAACFTSQEGKAALKAWAEAREAPAPAAQVARDAKMTNMDRQQPEDRPNAWATTMGSDVRDKVILSTDPVNPQADIQATGHHVIVIRDIDTWQGDGAEHGRHRLACVYGPHGRLLDTLSIDTLATLKQRFDRAQEGGLHRKMNPPAGSFEEEVADLLGRYKIKGKGTTQASDLLTAPTEMVEGMVQILGLTKERYASPLDVHPSITEYNSQHTRDMAFGADTDAHSAVWTGWSWGHPPHTTAAVDKAVAWAVASARATQETNTPSATLLLLPRLGASPAHLQRLALNPDVATHLLTIKGKRLARDATPCGRLLPAGWWAGGPSHRYEPARQDMDMVVIWNKTARESMGRQAVAMAEALRQQGGMAELLWETIPQAPGSPEAELADEERHEQWLSWLLLETVVLHVGRLHAGRMQRDRTGAPSQGEWEEAVLPTPLSDADDRELGRRAVVTDLHTLTGFAAAALSCVHGGKHWGVEEWTPTWKPDAHDPGVQTGFPKRFGKARESPEARHWGHAPLRAQVTGALGARDTVRPLAAQAMQAWGTPEHEARHPLKWYWRDIAYTDGSCIKPARGSAGPAALGAAVHIPASGERPSQTYLVAPGGEGPSWTITRAELAAIWAALEKGCRLIATDSLASIWLIQAIVCDPMRLRRNKHRPLLEAIADLIRAAPCPITLVKVAAHQGPGALGAIGNNEADAGARLAAGKEAEACDVHCNVAPHGFHDQVWITARTPQEDGTAKTEYVADLRSDLTRRTRNAHRLGRADPDKSTYASMWRKIAPATLPAASNAFASDTQTTHAQRRSVWAYRTGTLFNRKLEQRWFKTGDGLCPLCKQPDGGGHIVGGCRDKRMTGMYTERHNAVSRILLKAIAKGRNGAELCGADVGSHEVMQSCGLGHLSQQRRVATCLLPTNTSARSRPDAWMVTDGRLHGHAWLKTHEHKEPPEQRWNTSVTLIEVKMCPDTDPSQQRSRAEDQHAELEALLRQQLTDTTDCLVDRKTLLVGHSGTIYRDTLKALTDLGVARGAALTALAKAHRTACQHLHSIVGVRRHAEHHPSVAARMHGRGQKRHRPP